jgi:N-acetylglucosaminyl-diphospho-decaprenol L-rhamnosyltransferase
VNAPPITLSVVSHGQNGLVNALLQDLGSHCAARIRVVVTENIPDPTPLALDLPFPVERVANARIKGFGANHNAAFTFCSTAYFCVCNPDVRMARDPFDPLLNALAPVQAGVAGPLVRSPAGTVEDSARRFPTLASLARKALGKPRRPDYPADRGAMEVDWVAGMFMLFPAAAFRAVQGFDEGYFLYYEDADICRRLARGGRKVIYAPEAEIIHDARRGSRRNPTLARHHLASMLRYFARR